LISEIEFPWRLLLNKAWNPVSGVGLRLEEEGRELPDMVNAADQ